MLVPRTHNKHGDRSFSAGGPRLWNDLLPGLRRSGLTFDSMVTTVSHTKTFELIQIPFGLWRPNVEARTPPQFKRFCIATVVTNRKTDKPRHICSNRPHLYTLCTRCGLIITSCCSTDSERPQHRCCHLPNNSGSCQTLPVLHNGHGDAPTKLPLHLGEFGPPTNTCFLVPTRVHTRNIISIGSSVLAWLVAVPTGI